MDTIIKFFLKRLIICIVFLVSNLIVAQGVVNTESILIEIENGFNLSAMIEGDFQKGNVNLIEFNASNLFSYSTTNTLIRLINTYEYIEEDNEVISNDLTSHLRFNFYDKKRNSLFIFVQAQKAASLFQKRRILEGIGYRLRIFKNEKSNYFDLAPGFFFENEVYDFQNQITKINNFRMNLNNFFNLRLYKEISFSNVTYLQINSRNFNDLRIFIEPKLSYSFENLSLYLRYAIKHHSQPYINIFKNDTDLFFGIEFTLN